MGLRCASAAAAVLATQGQTVRGERLLDLLDRLLAEVRNRGKLVLCLHDEVADRLDPDALEAVVRADTELELLDREVLHPVRERRLSAAATIRRGRGLAEALDPVEIGEDRELANQNLSGLADRVAGIERAVGRDVQDQLVVVGALTDAGSLDVVRDAADRREDRVDRDDADRMLGPPVQLGGNVTPAAADRQRHLELALVGQVRDLEVRVEDLELRRCFDVLRRDRTRSPLRQADLDLRRVAVQARDQVLEVEEDVGDVLANAGQGGELVRDALDLDRGDCGALERGEQHAAQRVAERVAEAAIERLDLEYPTVLVDLLVDDLRDLELHQTCSCCHELPFTYAVRLCKLEGVAFTWNRARR